VPINGCTAKMANAMVSVTMDPVLPKNFVRRAGMPALLRRTKIAETTLTGGLLRNDESVKDLAIAVALRNF
jgi:hypothetical protein